MILKDVADNVAEVAAGVAIRNLDAVDLILLARPVVVEPIESRLFLSLFNIIVRLAGRLDQVGDEDDKSRAEAGFGEDRELERLNADDLVIFIRLRHREVVVD